VDVLEVGIPLGLHDPMDTGDADVLTFAPFDPPSDLIDGSGHVHG
jgi:hypothetical protein